MAIPHFFMENLPSSEKIILPEDTSKHCIQVLRMKTGEKIRLTDGKGNLLTTQIIYPDRKNCSVAVEQRNYLPYSSKKVSIAISLLKNSNRFEWFLEKAAEIGISEIIPMICERTEKLHLRFERMYNILVSAMLQSEQVWLPLLHEPSLFSNIISSSTCTQKLIAHCEHVKKSFVTTMSNSKDIQILIGPEGDFTPDEIHMALQQNFKEISLGETRLRSETAGIVAAALLMNSK